MRRRLAQLVYDMRDLEKFSSAVSAELGVDVPYPSDWRKFFEHCELQNVLDIITVAYDTSIENTSWDV